jgi:hypothetical protein
LRRDAGKVVITPLQLGNHTHTPLQPLRRDRLFTVYDRESLRIVDKAGLCGY